MNSFVDFERLVHFKIPCLEKIVHQSMTYKPFSPVPVRTSVT